MYPIPANATRIRYLESTGTQYVDMGVKLASDLTIRVRTRYQQKSASVVRAADGNNRAYILFGSGRSEANYNVQAINSTIGSGGSVQVALAFGEWADIVVSPSGLTVNGTTASSSGWSNYGTTNQNLYVFAFNDNGSASNFSSIPVASLDIYSGSTLVRDFQPVRVGQVGYLYDRVSGTFFGNAGTGSFVLGPDTFSQGVVPTRMMAMGLKNMPTSWNYVQSGLVAMWDGIENAGRGKHDASAMTWPDLTGTYTMTASASGDTWGKDHLNMGSTQWVVTPKSNFVNLINSPQKVGGEYSVEMVLSHTNQSNKCIFGRSFPTLDIHANGVRESVWLKNGTDINVGPTGGGLHSISLSGARDGSTSNVNQRWHYNGSNTNSATRSYSNDNTSDTRNVGLGLGEYTNRGIATAKIYCIRLYNRILTDDEVAYNYTVDKKRFNLP